MGHFSSDGPRHVHQRVRNQDFCRTFSGLEKQLVACVINHGQNSHMKIGYCRVSTEDQNPALQLAALQLARCKRIFTDKTTGAHIQRPQLTKCLAALQPGDVLVVWKLDRLGRSLRDLITLLDDLKVRDIPSGR
jgi:hypothetical protein